MRYLAVFFIFLAAMQMFGCSNTIEELKGVRDLQSKNFQPEHDQEVTAVIGFSNAFANKPVEERLEYCDQIFSDEENLILPVDSSLELASAMISTEGCGDLTEALEILTHIEKESGSQELRDYLSFQILLVKRMLKLYASTEEYRLKLQQSNFELNDHKQKLEAIKSIEQSLQKRKK